MTYVKFNPENEHKETCEFEEWKKEEGKMGFCGEPAYGKRGIGKAAKNLCEEHFSTGCLSSGRSRLKNQRSSQKRKTVILYRCRWGATDIGIGLGLC